MRLIPAVLLSLCVAAPSVGAAQTTPAQPAPTQTKPAQPKPTPRRAASPAAATTALSVTVTDGRGAPLSGVTVRASGPVDREGTTQAGTIRFEGLRSGMYRLRFSHENFVTLERDLNVPAGQRLLDQHVMLSAAEKPATPPPQPAPEPPRPAPLPPPGKAVTVSVPDFVEQNLIGSGEPQKVSSMACSGLMQTVLWQVREPWDKRQHTADAILYVVGGEGSLRMNDRDIPLSAGRFVSVPRGTTYGLTRRGRNPLILLASLAGEPCQP